MFADLDPHLKAIKDASLQGKIEKSLEDGRVVETIHDNQAEFRRLEEENRWLIPAYTAAGGAWAASVIIPEPVTKLGSFLAGICRSADPSFYRSASPRQWQTRFVCKISPTPQESCLYDRATESGQGNGHLPRAEGSSLHPHWQRGVKTLEAGSY
jgi:hypothetical protein